MNHIVVVTTSFPDAAFQAGQEAAGTFVYDFVMELARHIQLTAIAPSNHTTIESQENLTIRRFAVPSLPLSLLKPSNPRQWASIIKTMRSGQNAVQAAVTNDKVDHIVALWALPSGYWAKVIGANFGIPYSTWALGSDIWSLGKVPVVKNVLQSVLRQSQLCFADGYKLASDVTALSGRDCTFLPSSRQLPVTGTKILASAPPYKLAFLGRWHPHKGIDLLLESLQLLEDSDWANIEEIRICGGGPLEKLVQQQVEIMKKNGRAVSLHGYLNREEAAALLMWADYLLLPSRVESIPVVFSDAMQSDCPLISTPIGDLPRLMREHDIGVLAASVTAVAYTHAIQKALQTTPQTYQSGLIQTRTQFEIANSVIQLLSCLSTSSV